MAAMKVLCVVLILFGTVYLGCSAPSWEPYEDCKAAILEFSESCVNLSCEEIGEPCRNEPYKVPETTVPFPEDVCEFITCDRRCCGTCRANEGERVCCAPTHTRSHKVIIQCEGGCYFYEKEVPHKCDCVRGD